MCTVFLFCNIKRKALNIRLNGELVHITLRRKIEIWQKIATIQQNKSRVRCVVRDSQDLFWVWAVLAEDQHIGLIIYPTERGIILGFLDGQRSKSENILRCLEKISHDGLSGTL